MNRKVKDQVEFMLMHYPQTRNSDKLLFVKVLSHFYNVKDLEDILSPSVPPIETLRRHRQRFQEYGLYLCDEKVKKAREHQSSHFALMLQY